MRVRPFACAVGASLVLASTSTAQQPPPVTSLDALEWRHIGPASFGGRIDDVEAVPAKPSIIFVATASGGIFKTINAGVTWKPVFDEEGGSLSIGDVAIAPSDPNIVWAGKGGAKQSPELLLGRRRLQVDRWGRSLAAHGTEGYPPRRPNRDPSTKPRHCLHRRARTSLGPQ